MTEMRQGVLAVAAVMMATAAIIGGVMAYEARKDRARVAEWRQHDADAKARSEEMLKTCKPGATGPRFVPETGGTGLPRHVAVRAHRRGEWTGAPRWRRSTGWPRKLQASSAPGEARYSYPRGRIHR